MVFGENFRVVPECRKQEIRWATVFIDVNRSHQFTARCLAVDSMHDEIHGWHNGASIVYILR